MVATLQRLVAGLLEVLEVVVEVVVSPAGAAGAAGAAVAQQGNHEGGISLEVKETAG